MNENENLEGHQDPLTPKQKKSFNILTYDVLPLFVVLFTIFWLLFVTVQFIILQHSIGTLICSIAFGLLPLVGLILHRKRINKTQQNKSPETQPKILLGMTLIVLLYVLAISGHFLQQKVALEPSGINFGLIKVFLNLLAIISIVKRLQWGWHFNLGLAAYDLLLTIYNNLNREPFTDARIESIREWFTISIIAVYLLILFYLYKRKSYFTEHKTTTI